MVLEKFPKRPKKEVDNSDITSRVYLEDLHYEAYLGQWQDNTGSLCMTGAEE